MELSPVYPLRDESNDSPEILEVTHTESSITEILKGVTAYVEVRSNAENRSRAISRELEELGAVVSNRLTVNVTHVIYREGRKRTKDWAQRHSVPLVCVGWIQACKRLMRRIPESNFLAADADPCCDEASPVIGFIGANQGRRRVRSMQPKDMDEDLKLSADRKRRASRRNAKRDALHRRVVEAENCLRSIQSEQTRDYYANPCIRVPRTPPSMKEYTERMERKKGSSDSDTNSSVMSQKKCPPRRRLFGSSVMEQSENNLVEDSSCLKETPMKDIVTPRTRRKLFDASAFEASGVIIEPQHSSNRLQNISEVFPKSFRKRRIMEKKPIPKKTLKMVYDDNSVDEFTEDTDDLDFVTTTKSRRLSAEQHDISVKSEPLEANASSVPNIPILNSVDISSRDDVSESEHRSRRKSVIFERSKNFVCKSPTEGTHFSFDLGDSRDDTRETTIDNVKSEDVTVVSTRSDDHTTVDVSNNSTPVQVPQEPSSSTSVSNATDFLGVIEQATRLREILKKPGCSTGRQRSVRFSDCSITNADSESPVISPIHSTHSSPSSSVLSTESRSPISVSIDFLRKVNRRSFVSSTASRRSKRLSKNDDFDNKVDTKDTHSDREKSQSSQDTDILKSCMDILSEADKTTKETGNYHTQTPPSSPKCRRSKRISAQNVPTSVKDSSSQRSLSSVSLGSTSNSSKTSSIRHILNVNNRRSCPEYSKHTVRDGGLSSKRAPSDTYLSSHRYRYKDDPTSSELHEKAYGVLDIPEPKVRKSKRCSVAAIVNTLLHNDDSPGNDSDLSLRSDTERTHTTRTSLDDFKLHKASAESDLESPWKAVPTVRKNKKRSSQVLRRVVFTSLHSDEQEQARKAMKSLGEIRLFQKVTNTTTHVVTTWPIRRTLNLLRGIVFGCHIVCLSWLLESREAGMWLPEENYTIKEVPGPDQHPAIRSLFENYKDIFVENNVSPPQRELKELIHLAGGKTTSSSQSASIIISSQNENLTCVSPRWILDSIMESEALPLNEYKLARTN